MSTVNPSQTSQEYILSVKLALDPEIKAATDTLARMRKELDTVGRELAKASKEFASQGGDATKAAESLRKYNEVLRGTGSSLDATNAKLEKFGGTGFDATGTAAVRLSTQMSTAMRSIERSAEEANKKLEKFGGTGFDVTGTAVVRVSSQMAAAMRSLDAPAKQAKDSMAGWAASMNQLEAELNTLPQKISVVNTKLRELAAAGQQGTGSWMAYMSELKRLEDMQRKLDSVNRGSTEGFRNLRFAVQNTSYQLQDMAIQMQMGTRASVIMAQQVPQILSAFGALGAIAGVIVAVGASLAGPFLDDLFKTTGGVKEFEESLDALSKIADDFGKVDTKFDTQSMRKAFNEADKATRALIIAQMELQLELLNTQHKLNTVKYDKFVADMVPALTAMDNFTRRFKLMFSGLGGEQFEAADEFEAQTQRMRKSMEEFGVPLGQLQEIQAALRSGGESAAEAFRKYGATLAAGTPKAQEAAKILSIMAQEHIKYTNAVKGGTKTLEEARNAYKTGGDMMVESTKKTKTEVKELTEGMKSLLDVELEMLKLAKPRWELPIKISELEANIESWKAFGLTHQQIIKVIGDAEIALKKARGEWTLYDQVIQDMVADQDKIKQYEDTLAALLDQLARGDISPENFQRALLALQKYAPAMERIGEKAKETKTSLEEMAVAMGTVLGNALDNLLDTLLTSQNSFRDWAISVLKELSKVLIKMAAVAAFKKAMAGTSLGAMFGFAAGAAFAAPTGLPTNTVINQPTPFFFAQGGVFGPRMGVGGEAGPEAIVPLKRTSAGNLGVESSPVIINVNNTVSNDTKVDVAETQRPDGTREITLTVRREMKSAMADGSMDQSMRANYGINRRAVLT